jgi:quinol monooxygenase YgiN
MYGIIAKLTAVEGQREALLSALMSGHLEMPGCLIYVVARDAVDERLIWITEVWTDRASHERALQRTEVTEAIARARPFIAEAARVASTEPVGGQGLASKPVTSAAMRGSSGT